MNREKGKVGCGLIMHPHTGTRRPLAQEGSLPAGISSAPVPCAPTPTSSRLPRAVSRRLCSPLSSAWTRGLPDLRDDDNKCLYPFELLMSPVGQHHHLFHS